MKFMRLNNVGVVPSVTPPELMPSRVDLAHFCGPKSSTGFAFHSQDNPAYEEYIRDLYTRVLQVVWPISRVIPFHFARGLLAEARGMDVNWAEFVYKMTHPHQPHARLPRILPCFEALTAPLQPLQKVIPITDDLEVCSPFPTPSIAVHLLTACIICLEFCNFKSLSWTAGYRSCSSIAYIANPLGDAVSLAS